MATAAKKTASTAVAKTKGPSNEVAERKTTALAAPSEMMDEFAADAGQGMENVDADSVAIPFLTILQKNSPQCDPDAGEYIAEAKPGMIYNTVTKELFEARENGILFVPCYFQRKFLRWAARETGGGFRGEVPIDQIDRMKANGQLVEMEQRLYVPLEDRSINPKKSDRVSDTRVHYVLFLHPQTGQAQQALLSLASTQIKKSRQLIAMLGNVIMEAGGQKRTPPSFANLVRLKTVPEQNEKGSWSGVTFEMEGFVQDSPTYRQAKQFWQLVHAGQANVNFEQAGGMEGAGMENADAGGGKGF